MKYAMIVLSLLTGTAAKAHPGHMAEAAGHGHWLGAAALGAAIAIGLWAGLKGRKPAAEAQTEDETADEELQEA
ncbi:hypothetical protein PEL8287_03178 [Roseovarius litorisediminis]|uniref:Uncharacterized protein n=1 Tax=Roseovarius litorisediminis TaxID=1312363 RepID=A0A1Y5TFD0_9RHOB|nr:DUF6732 family protein [Roseovarius litorisediminis]SLN59012.1 hypothetical protein PEL8287_03178 [Roseovarius litorisediminis]